MFHVLEHMPHQVEILKKLKKKLIRGGNLIVEVPSANDFLLLIDDLKIFKSFKFIITFFQIFLKLFIPKQFHNDFYLGNLLIVQNR